jgi:NAD kinase
MKFIVIGKEVYGEEIRKDVVRILEENGAEHTSKIEPGCDFAIIVGGDGTLLRYHSEMGCPVLGINPGKSIGYYMCADNNDYGKKVLSLVNGKVGKDYFVYRLSRLEASVNGKTMPVLALNDVLVNPIYVRRIMESVLTLDKKESTEKNSGVIFYTPTGSHAFAHSAGARKMKYDSKLLGVAALAPYSGVLKKQEILCKRGPVKLEYLSKEGEVGIDGSEINLRKLKRGDTVSVRKSKKFLRLVGFSRRFG